jgi:toxin HigB-1
MVRNFRLKGLGRLFESGSAAGVDAKHATRLQRLLALLETADSLDDMSLPGLNLHELKGKRKGTWAVKVDENWRVTFRLDEGDVWDVTYEDYH